MQCIHFQQNNNMYKVECMPYSTKKYFLFLRIFHFIHFPFSKHAIVACEMLFINKKETDTLSRNLNTYLNIVPIRLYAEYYFFKGKKILWKKSSQMDAMQWKSCILLSVFLSIYQYFSTHLLSFFSFSNNRSILCIYAICSGLDWRKHRHYYLFVWVCCIEWIEILMAWQRHSFLIFFSSSLIYVSCCCCCAGSGGELGKGYVCVAYLLLQKKELLR